MDGCRRRRPSSNCFSTTSENDNVALVFIDNSNIFINTQQHSARIKEYLPNVQDSCRRIDYRKLLNVACEGKLLLAGKLYGSEPPPLKKVWDAIRRSEIEVHTSKKSFLSKEKATDTALIADAVELIIERKNPDLDQHFILFSGDRDMLPVVLKAIRHGWNVQVWAYRNSIAKDFEREKRKGDKIEIFYMDDYFDAVTFSEPYLDDQKIPRERSLVLTFSNAPRSLDDHTKDTFARKIVETTSTVFRLPTQGRFLKDNENDFVVVICPEENCYVDHKKRLSYEFNLDVYKKAEQLKSKLDKCVHIQTFMEYSQNEEDYSSLLFYGDVCPGDKNKNSTEDMEEYQKDLIGSSSPTTFETMKQKPKKRHTKYSDKCVYGFRCAQAERCSYSHTAQEKEYFKVNQKVMPEKRYLHKSKMCNRPHCEFSLKTYLCPFAHDIKEARCLKCKKYGHLTDSCAFTSNNQV